MHFANRSSKLRTDNRLTFSGRKLAPMIEIMESRQLLTAGAGFLTGSVLLDGPAGAPVSGVTIQLFKASDTSSPVSTQTTGANGQYLFTGLPSGDYLLKEVAPTGYTANGANPVSQLDPASAVGPDTIKVSVVDPSRVFVNYGGIVPTSYSVVNDVVQGAAQVNSVGPQADTLGTAAGRTDLNPGFHTFCVNDQQSLSFGGGEKYQVAPRPIGELTNGSGTVSADHSGRIAYLFNHYGNTSLSNIQGAGLQLAIWELLYDSGDTANFSSGDFQVPSLYKSVSGETLAQVLAQAQSDFNASAGKSETAVWLDASPYASSPQGVQSVLAAECLNFSVAPTCLTTGQTATIGFWNNKNGQALIDSFNGGPTSTALGNWLAANFPNLYGQGTGGALNPDDLTGKTNADVAALFQKDFNVQGMKADAQVLAVALADYATTSSLGGTAAVAYGFTVTADGVGAAGFNVGSNGAAFGVPNGTVLTVFQILKATDASAKNGLLYGGDTTLISQANAVFDGINQGGDIS